VLKFLNLKLLFAIKVFSIEYKFIKQEVSSPEYLGNSLILLLYSPLVIHAFVLPVISYSMQKEILHTFTFVKLLVKNL
jgi:hypothetical protein